MEQRRPTNKQINFAERHNDDCDDDDVDKRFEIQHFPSTDSENAFPLDLLLILVVTDRLQHRVTDTAEDPER